MLIRGSGFVFRCRLLVSLEWRTVCSSYALALRLARESTTCVEVAIVATRELAMWRRDATWVKTNNLREVAAASGVSGSIKSWPKRKLAKSGGEICSKGAGSKSLGKKQQLPESASPLLLLHLVQVSAQLLEKATTAFHDQNGNHANNSDNACFLGNHGLTASKLAPDSLLSSPERLTCLNSQSRGFSH